MLTAAALPLCPAQGSRQVPDRPDPEGRDRPSGGHRLAESGGDHASLDLPDDRYAYSEVPRALEVWTRLLPTSPFLVIGAHRGTLCGDDFIRPRHPGEQLPWSPDHL